MHLRSLYLLSSIAFLLTACKKDDPDPYVPGPVAPAVNPIRSILQANVEAATQSFTINAATGGTINAANGSRIHFQPGAMVTAAGAPLGGMVTVEVVEVLDVADMVWLNKQTAGVWGNEVNVLKSGGALKVEARLGDTEVFIAPGGAIIQLPTNEADPEMQVFAGNEDAEGDVVWELRSDAVTIAPADTSGFGGSDYFYSLTVDSLNWINCDYFPNPTLGSCMFSTAPGITAGNTMIWLVIPSLNAVMNIWDNGTNFGLSVPYGLEAIVVGLYAQGDEEFSSTFTPITTGPGPFPLNFIPTTLAEFEADLQGL
jgi:hypothetical protein